MKYNYPILVYLNEIFFVIKKVVCINQLVSSN